jgi:hypothetical protein
MRIVARWPRAPLCFPILLLALLALAVGSTEAQYQRFKTRSVQVPEPTSAGNWDGTYWYVSRDLHLAAWIRTTDGLPEVRLQLRSRVAPEEFITDWNGEATYETRKGRGEFALSLTERNAEIMKGTWTWNLQVGKTVRKQFGEVTLYRAGIGREVVVWFSPYKFYIGEVGAERWQSTEQVWTLRKASKRLVRWEELPF